MKKKSKKNLHADYQSASFKKFVSDYKEGMFQDMSRDGAYIMPHFKETWDYIEECLEEDDRYINLLIPFMTFYLNLILLEEDKEERKKHIWGVWYYLKLDEPLFKYRFKEESEKLVQHVDRLVLKMIRDEYPAFLKWLHYYK